jgi:hypothetical protein
MGRSTFSGGKEIPIVPPVFEGPEGVDMTFLETGGSIDDSMLGSDDNGNTGIVGSDLSKI